MTTNFMVNELIVQEKSTITSSLWADDDPVPHLFPLKIDAILQHNNNLLRYLAEHANEVNDFQLKSIEDMLCCVGGEFGGVTYFCEECGDSRFIPFHCNGRVCSRCGKKYAEKWGRTFMDRFYRWHIGM